YSNYYGSYWPAPLTNGSLIQAQGGRVPSQLFHDMTFGYSFDDGGRSFLPKLTDGLSVSGGIRNVLNTTPEVDIGNQTFSYMSGFGDARLRSYHITMTKQF